MRKYVIGAIVFLCGLLYAGCGEGTYTVSIINTASRAVSYRYNGKNDTIPASTGDPVTQKYTVKAYTQPPGNIVDENGIISITMINRQGETYTFIPAASMDISAVNTLSAAVTIKAGYYIDKDKKIYRSYMDNNGSSELTIAAGETKTAIIYTEKPEFTAVSDHPAVVDWNITKPADTENKIMYITIR